MSLLIASIPLPNIDALDARAIEAWAGGADAVELRIDAFEGSTEDLATYLRSHGGRTWIVTCRSAVEGGHFSGDTAERVSRLLASARGTRAYVDFELADWRRSANIRQKIQLACADGDGHRLILSTHDLHGRPDGVRDLVREVLSNTAAPIAKVAYRSPTIVDSFGALDLQHEFGDRVVAIAMGEDGLWSRVLARKLGAWGSFCCLTNDDATAAGQLALAQMSGPYRWPSIDADTRVYGVLGDPVGHSMSPALFNQWFASENINAVYLPLRVRGGDDCLDRFLGGCVARPWLDVGGFSVTIPYKQAALQWVGDGADWLANCVGALNTLVMAGNRPTGYNTDAHAAIDSLVAGLNGDHRDLAGLPVDVLGTGGAARAVLTRLGTFGCKTTVYGRSAAMTRELADKHGAVAEPWTSRGERKGKVLINCTSVGMWPSVNDSPMPGTALDGCELVFDLIYNPLQTRLLREADAAGAATLNGLDMFIRQASMQFQIWTGRAPDIAAGRAWLEHELRSMQAVQR